MTTRPLQDGDIEIAYFDGSTMVKLTIRQSKTAQLGRKTLCFCPKQGIARVLFPRYPISGQFVPRQYLTPRE